MQEDVSTFSKSIEPSAAMHAKIPRRDVPHAARPFFHSYPLILVVRLPPVPRHRVQIAPAQAVVLRLLPCAVPEPICNSHRDPETHEPHEYYCKLPEPIDRRQIVVVDPMLATGNRTLLPTVARGRTARRKPVH